MAQPRSSPPVARGVLVAGGLATLLLIAVSPRYGFHRDELYFLVAGRRLDWGYVDQPPLVPLIARISETLFGTSPTAIRLLPAIAIGVTAVVAAVIARRLGGGRVAQIAAAVATAWSGVALAVGHLLATVTFDYLLWTVALYFVVRVLGGDQPRWWIAVGAAVGCAMLNKHLVVGFAAALLLGLLLSRRRGLLASPWPWFGATLALVIGLPNLLWQASNGWPQLDMARALADRSEGPVAFVLQQIALLSIVFVLPAAVGLWRLLRTEEWERFRPIGVAFIVLFVAFLATGGKAYYIAPMYPMLLAAGGIWFERLPDRRRRSMGSTAAVGIVIGSLIALPLVPLSAVKYVDATGELGESAGWPLLIDEVVRVYESIPADQRGAVTIFTGNYGEAGAVDVLGADRGLPPATSGHNTYWLWGPPESHGPIIAIGPLADTLLRICPAVDLAATITNPWDIGNEEQGMPIFLCSAPTGQLADIWDDVRHYN